MDKSLDKMKPYLIGIAGGKGSGKKILTKRIANSLNKHTCCVITLDSFFKELTEKERLKISSYNYCIPQSMDFDLLHHQLLKILNWESIEVPIFDKNKGIRESKSEKLDPCSVILLEGALAFYDERIRNMIDLKVFIDTDSDIRLLNVIQRSNINEMQKEVSSFLRFDKPVFQDYIKPTKQFADIFLQNIEADKKKDENELNKNDENNNENDKEKNIVKQHKIVAIETICDYFNLLIDKLNKGDIHYIFSSINKIIDPKVKYFNNKILAPNDQNVVGFLKKLFEDFYSKEQDLDFIQDIKEELIYLLINRIAIYYKEKGDFFEILENVNLVITENDDIHKFESQWKEKYKHIVFFKTAILSEDDLAIPKMILEKHKKAYVIVNSVFLAPKFAENLLNNNLNTIMFNSLYFSDFFLKFEHLIRTDNNCFEPKFLADLFKEKFNSQLLEIIINS